MQIIACINQPASTAANLQSKHAFYALRTLSLSRTYVTLHLRHQGSTFKYGLSLQFAAVADGRTEEPHKIWAQCAPAFLNCLSPTGLPGYRNSNFQNLHSSGLEATLRPGAMRLPGLAHRPLCREHMQRSPAWAPGMSPGTQSCSDKKALQCSVGRAPDHG